MLVCDQRGEQRAEWLRHAGQAAERDGAGAGAGRVVDGHRDGEPSTIPPMVSNPVQSRGWCGVTRPSGMLCTAMAAARGNPEETEWKEAT